MPCHPTCITNSSLRPAERDLFVRVTPTICLDSFTYCELRSVAPVALAHQSLRLSQNDNVHDRGCRDDGRGGGRISHRSPHLRNGLVRSAVALHVMAGGHVPTESGGRQTARGARKGSIHKDCIRARGGLLARTGRASGLVWQEGSLPSKSRSTGYP